MGLNIGITNDYLKNNASVPENLQKYILWAKAREGGSPGLKPSLDLDFARNKSLIDNVTGQNLVTFTRASSATYFDSQGVLQTATTDVPRFDHNPVTGESLGLLVEEQRTNLLLRSEEFDNASWTLFGTTSRSANATTAPNGSLTADSVTLPVGTAGIYQLVSASASTSYTFSVWIRADSSQTVRLVINTNLSDPSVLTVTATTAWQRFSITKTTSVGTTSVTAQLDTGGGNTFYLWGAQLESGAFPTSYIPTTTATVTRSADVASITGSAFSSFYRQDKGTMYARASIPAFSAISTEQATQFSVNDGSINNFMRLRGFSSSGAFTWDALGRVGGVDQFDTDAKQYSQLNAAVNNALAYSVNNIANSVNGQNPSTDSSASLPTVNRAEIGATIVGSHIGAQHLRRLTYWPQRLPNETLQTITQ